MRTLLDVPTHVGGEPGVYKGRVKALTTEQVEQARDRVAAGVPKAVVARSLGVSRQTLYDALAGRGVYASETA